MFNLLVDTKHEAGVILYEEGAVGVFNWGQLDDGFVPMVGPSGLIVPWPVAAGEDVDLIHIGTVDDVRTYLPGTVWMGEDGLETDMSIVYDGNDDIPALWGFGPSSDVYVDVDRPYSGDIWEIPGGPRVITIGLWQ